VALGVQVLDDCFDDETAVAEVRQREASIRAATASACATGIRPFATM